MKITYKILYLLSGIIFFISVFGNSLTKPIFDFVSEKTLEISGFKKSYLESADDKIDDMIYKSRQLELQIEKIKKFFSSEKPDESKYQKEKSEFLEKTFYSPLVLMFNYFYRAGFIMFAFIILSFGVIFHLIYRSYDLRTRVRLLEKIVLANQQINEI